MESTEIPKGEGDLRRQILDTTRHLLVEEGYKSLSMRKIARAIGYSATSIYLHFESKDALVHTLIDEGMARMHTDFESASAACVDDPRARLLALCRAYIEFGLANPEYYEIMYMLHPEEMARFPAEKYRRARRNLEAIAEAIAEGAACGHWHAADPLLAATTVWATLHGAVSLIFSRRMDIRIEQSDFVDTILTQTLHYYTHPAPQNMPNG